MLGERKRLYLNDFFTEKWKDKDPFAAAEALAGEVFREVKNRRTFRFELDGRAFFAKVHRGVGWREILKNVLMFKLPALGADNEYDAIDFYARCGGKTMTVCAFGSRNWDPANRESFLITGELKNMPNLEEYTASWRNAPPPAAERFLLTEKLAEATAKMHRNGINHRDCYLCHFMLKKPEYDLYVIDLHRSQIRKSVPRHYLVKDLAGLYFSSLDAGAGTKDFFRFLKVYFDLPLRRILKEKSGLLKAVKKAGDRLYRREKLRRAKGKR